jgi:transposase-like protein
MDSIAKIYELYYKLTVKEQNEVLLNLNNQSYGTEIAPIKPHKCPHCGNEKVVSNGSVNGRKRYLCRGCKRSFGNFSETTLNDLKKSDKFLTYKNILFNEGLFPLRLMCKRVGISIQTSFDWRHKLMNSLSDDGVLFTGETQLDDLWYNYNLKGRRGLKYARKRGGSKKAGDNNFRVKVLTAANKNQTVMKVATIGRVSKSDIDCSLGRYFDDKTKLVSDSHPSIIGFAKDRELKHVFFKAKEHVAKTGENVQLVNSIAERLKKKLNVELRGVATKYLQNYANWFSFTETNKSKDANKLATIAILEDTNGWDTFTNAESVYKEFIENHSVRTYRCPVSRSWKSNNWNMHKIAS